MKTTPTSNTGQTGASTSSATDPLEQRPTGRQSLQGPIELASLGSSRRLDDPQQPRGESERTTGRDRLLLPPRSESFDGHPVNVSLQPLGRERMVHWGGVERHPLLSPVWGSSPGDSPGGSSRSGEVTPRTGSFRSFQSPASSAPSSPPPQSAGTQFSTPAPASAYEEVRRKLAGFPFRSPPGEQLQAQELLEERYIDWVATNVIEPRRRAFGNGAYSLSRDMAALGTDVALPAAYQFGRQFVSSSSRSPATGATTARLAPPTTASPDGSAPTPSSSSVPTGEFTNDYDPNVIGGVVGGGTAYVGRVVQLAMDRRAEVANFPKLKAVELKALVPEPGPVQLRIEGGLKEYVVLPDAARAAWGEVDSSQAKHEAQVHRNGLKRQQALLEGKPPSGVVTQALLTGSLNAFRRSGTDESLTTPALIFLNSIWASGFAGAAARAAFEVLKGVPALSQARVDNFVGGQQTVNLFALRAPNPDAPTPTWSDALGFPRFTVEAGLESLSLLGQGFDNLLRRRFSDVLWQATDLAWHGFANASANVAAFGAGRMIAQLVRGRGNDTLPNEPLQSEAYRLQQFGQSATSELMWQGIGRMSDVLGPDLGAALDKRRERYRLDAYQAAARLPALVEAFASKRRVSGHAELEAAPAQALQAIRTLTNQPDQTIPRVQTLQSLRAALATDLAPEAATTGAQSEYDALLAGLDRVIKHLARHEKQMLWQRKPQAGSGSERNG